MSMIVCHNSMSIYSRPLSTDPIPPPPVRLFLTGVVSQTSVGWEGTKGPSQKYLEANEVKYFSLGGGGGGGRRFHGHYLTFLTKIGFMLVFTIIE